MPEWIGKTIGKVRIEKLLARGGTAEVYLGTHVTLVRPVAVKVLHSYIEEEPMLLERFQREARVVAGLRHPNIVQVFDFDTIDGHPYIVMEYLKGPTLATYLRHLHQRKKRSPPAQVAQLLNGLTSALDYAHARGVIHRDIKPGNILLHGKTDEFPLDKPLPNDIEAVVTDFGLVRVVDVASPTSGIISGTPVYMSPEQALGPMTDHRTDIYSLGIVLYEMLAGHVPFKADNTLTVLHMHGHAKPLPIPGISPKVQAVIDRALQKNPDDRYQTGRALSIDYSSAAGLAAEREIMQKPDPVRSVPIEEPVTLPPPVSLPAHLLPLLTHDNSSVRKLAVQELVGLLDGQHLGLARAAEEKLREIAATDDSLTLRKIAIEALNTHGFETAELMPVQIQKEKSIAEVFAPQIIPVSPQSSPPPVAERPKTIPPAPRFMQWKLIPAKLEKRLVLWISGTLLGIVLLVGASQLFFGNWSIFESTPTASATLTQPPTSTSLPTLTITPNWTQTSSLTPSLTQTRTSTPTPTLTATLTPTRTLILPTVKPTRKPRDEPPKEH